MKLLRTTTVLGLACAALLAHPLHGQSTVAADGDALARAEAMEASAEALADRVGEYGRAARLYREAAALRTEDPLAARSYLMAGRLAYYDGHYGDAVRDLTRAAETALSFGQVSDAAQAFLDAAWVAHRDGAHDRALSLAKRGERLASSPLLARAERADILSRIAESPDGTVAIRGLAPVPGAPR